MSCIPRGDKAAPDHPDPTWLGVLAHRRFDGPDALEAAAERFTAAGLTPSDVVPHLADAGDALYAAAVSGAPDWAERFGGVRGAALLAAEVSALMSHLVARAAGVRALSIDGLLDDYSAITVAHELGVARQKVYQLARPELEPHFLTTTPWRIP